MEATSQSNELCRWRCPTARPFAHWHGSGHSFDPLLNVAVAHILIDDSATAYRFGGLGRDLGLPSTIGPLPDTYAQLAAHEGRYDDTPEFLIAALPPAMAADGGAETVGQLFRVLRDRSSTGTTIEALDAWCARTTPADMTQIMKRRFMVWYTELGALDRAFAVASESLDHFAQSGTIGVAWTFLWMREMLPFRQDACFQSLCRRMRMFEYWNKYGPPDHCELHDGALLRR